MQTKENWEKLPLAKHLAVLPKLRKLWFLQTEVFIAHALKYLGFGIPWFEKNVVAKLGLMVAYINIILKIWDIPHLLFLAQKDWGPSDTLNF